MIQTLRCQIASHDQAKINSICFNTKCQGKRVCCQRCLIEFHKDHIEQSVDLDDILNYIKTSSNQPAVPSPEVNQALIELTKAQQNLDGLQKIIKQEISRLSTLSLQTICKNIGIKYNVLEGQVQSLENKQWNQLAQDMIRDFDVQKGKIILKHPFVNQLGQDYFKFMNEFQQIMRIIVQDFKLISQMHVQMIPDFQSFTVKKELTGHTDCVRGIDICRHRNLLASSSSDKTVKLWNLENNTLINTYQYSHTVFDVVFSKQGNLLAFGGDSDYSVKLIDISDLKKDNPILELKGHKGCVRRLTFSNDSKYLISASDDETVIIWDVLQRKQLFQLNSGDCVYGVGISDDDTLLASNSDDGNIIIWNFKNQNLLCTHKAHYRGSGIQFSKDQKMLVSCGYDGMIKLWSLAELNNQSKLLLIREFKTATNRICSALFSPCSNFIISMSNQDREIKVIDSETGTVVKLFKSKATNRWDFIQVAISKYMDVIAYGEGNNVVVWRQK